MMFESIRFINHVYENCYALNSEQGTFNAEEVIKKLNLPEAPDTKSDYWQKKNTTNSLNILEKMRLISGTIEPEHTTNFKFVKEVRYASITKFGKLFNFFPKMFRLMLIATHLKKQQILAVLGVLSFVRLANNAYIGASLVSNWIEYLAALIVLYIIYLLILRIIDQ